jgi:hypothetical protein
MFNQFYIIRLHLERRIFVDPMSRLFFSFIFLLHPNNGIYVGISSSLPTPFFPQTFISTKQYVRLVFWISFDSRLFITRHKGGILFRLKRNQKELSLTHHHTHCKLRELFHFHHGQIVAATHLRDRNSPLPTNSSKQRLHNQISSSKNRFTVHFALVFVSIFLLKPNSIICFCISSIDSVVTLLMHYLLLIHS